MRILFLRCFTSLFLTTVLAVPFLCAGCAVHARVVDDPYYHDHHEWATERPYYNRWETETHRDHKDFNKRSKDDQKAYWDWRHNQEH